MRSKTETVWIKHTEVNLMYRSQLSLYWLEQIRRSIRLRVHLFHSHSEQIEEPLTRLWIAPQPERVPNFTGGILPFAHDDIGMCAAKLNFQLLRKPGQNSATRFGDQNHVLQTHAAWAGIIQAGL